MPELTVGERFGLIFDTISDLRASQQRTTHRAIYEEFSKKFLAGDTAMAGNKVAPAIVTYSRYLQSLVDGGLIANHDPEENKLKRQAWQRTQRPGMERGAVPEEIKAIMPQFLIAAGRTREDFVSFEKPRVKVADSEQDRQA